MLNLMIDLETLALDDDALITQIGLLVFDEHYLPCGELCVNIDITAAMLDGFKIDPGTVKFWRGQNKEVVNSVLYAQPRLTPRLAAQLLDKWIKDTFQGEDFTIWANGILFDIPKMDNLMTRYGLKPLTSHTRYSKIQDFRTLRNAAKELHPVHYEHAKSIIKNDSLHNALADCYWQLETLGAIMQILGGKYHLVGDTDPIESGYDSIPAMLHNADEVTMVTPAISEVLTEDTMGSWEDDEEGDQDFFEHVYGGEPDSDEPKVIGAGDL